MASLDGQLVFGDAVKVTHTLLPRGTQVNTYPGIDGTEELDMGFRSRTTVVTGRLAGTTPDALGATENLLCSFLDGATHVLIDPEGRIFPYVKFVGYQEVPESRRFAPPYGYTLRYQAMLRHIL